ncbi:MAG: ATP synthase F1 subunit gamma [Bdellovibrionales bacterium]|nr:ATP synthase F1 subunit gamma [Bdellovibrionales bacterium]
MPSLKDIRNRIGSVKNTQKITKAMKMVSAAKLKRAQDRITHLRPYALGLLGVIADIAVTKRVVHPLLSSGKDPKKILTVVVTSDRGLCGGFNSSVIREIEKRYAAEKSQYEVYDFIFVGRKVANYFENKKIFGIDKILHVAKDISYGLSNEIAEKLMAAYQHGEYDEIRLTYNEFKSAIQQNVITEKLLPVDVNESGFVKTNSSQFSEDLIFEPEPTEIIDELLNKHFAVQIYRILSESVAAEHGARMTAMENATNNAGDMIRSMTLTYNKLRQAAITKELIEISSGAEALN